MIEIGTKDTIKIRIKRESKNNTFGKIVLEIQDVILINNTEGDLGFLCVDLESSVLLKGKHFNNESLWGKTEEELLNSWKKYFSETEKYLYDPDIEKFDKEFNEVNLPWDSEFFDNWIFIAKERDSIIDIKCWKKKEAKEILDFSISSNIFFKTLDNVSNYLRTDVF